MEESMTDVREKRLGGFAFDGVFETQQGGILCQDLGSNTPDASNMKLGLKAGKKYKPGTFACAFSIFILDGKGEFQHGEKIIPYASGSIFRVAAHVLHGFVNVETTTVFVSHASSTTPLRK
jgi:hypothetical protein